MSMWGIFKIGSLEKGLISSNSWLVLICHTAPRNLKYNSIIVVNVKDLKIKHFKPVFVFLNNNAMNVCYMSATLQIGA